jgi:vancomycin permeability regulator SanA
MKTLVNSLIVAALLSPFFLIGNSVYQVNFYESGWEEKEASECLIILGSRSLPGGVPGLMMRERLAMAETVITDDTKTIILTGGSLDEEKTEAEVMQGELLRNGVNEERMVLENRSTSTYENLIYSKPLLKERNCDDVDILTHDFHLARTKMTADALDLKSNRMIPVLNATANTRARLSREYLAYMWYWLRFL